MHEQISRRVRIGQRGTLLLLVFIVMTMLVIWFPKNLLYGKEEHSNPALEPSALRDAIEDTIAAKVKPECLKNPPN